ncbi:virulence factor MviN [Gemella sp. oral taxon 928]|uniref:oligosaccharide flippase family protein n=1 Tax=Gemella sp. oral taxon 928 TaxID=1785995 RepID=UPI0007684299|nr:oligosaccharide flippase family protein [Gemella sp. oral taxon 928]AME08893.1 virulence factor MviN [Gemella sp. oral taxon 928]
MKNIKINALASLMVNVLNIVFPLITNPYLTRILSKSSYGYFNTANTWVSFVIPLAAFGIYNYGIRSISKVKDDKNRINYIFSKLFYISILTSVITTICYFLFINSTEIENLKILYYILGIQAFFQFLNIEWMNEAYENYTFILYKTLFIRIAMLVSIFVFVKTADDIIPYTIIMSATTILNYLLSFIWIKREVRFVKVPLSDLLASFKGLTTMLLLANANMLYTLLDRMYITKGQDENFISYYTIASSIVMLIANVLGGALNVSLPRLGYYLGKKDYKAYESLVNQGSALFYFLIIPTSIGISILGTYATVIYSSEKYLEAGIVTSVFAVRTIIWAVELILGKQIIFINNYENRLTSYYFIGGGINILLNSLLFFNHLYRPEYYIATTMLAELFVVILEILFIVKHKLISLKTLFNTVFKYTAISLGFIPIYFICKTIFNINSYAITFNMLLMIICVVVISGIYYLIALYISKDKTLNYVISIAKNKIQR